MCVLCHDLCQLIDAVESAYKDLSSTKVLNTIFVAISILFIFEKKEFMDVHNLSIHNTDYLVLNFLSRTPQALISTERTELPHLDRILVGLLWQL